MSKDSHLSPAVCRPYRPGCCTRRRCAPYELSQSASFWVARAFSRNTFWTSAATAMTYPQFAEEWHLTHTVTTGVFADPKRTFAVAPTSKTLVAQGQRQAAVDRPSHRKQFLNFSQYRMQ